MSIVNLRPCVAIIQARLGSSRLPLKSLLLLKNSPIIDWVVRRVSQAKLLDKVVVAIPNTHLDEILHEHLTAQGITCLRGPEDDVLARFCLVAEKTKAASVVRICADNPLVSYEAIDQLIEHFTSHPCDYAYNHIPRNNLWPDGLGAEILSSELLFKLEQKAKSPSEREHCLNYIWNNASKFHISTFNPTFPELCRPELKLDLDQVADYERLAHLPIFPEISLVELMQIFKPSA
ncbi:MAG: NTP transferase domain-containing protein [Desulfovibrio sp.]|nr:NTP transferase domain-containing protein [Desulfovibrio sp.]